MFIITELVEKENSLYIYILISYHLLKITSIEFFVVLNLLERNVAI